jgi:uncharacterized protein (DUF1800 family)
MGNREAVAHLLRRATFGPRAEEVDAAEKAGYDATVRALFDVTSTPDAGAARTPVPQLGADPATALAAGATREQRQQAQQQRRDQARAVTLWWLDRMVAADHQVHEKLTFFWHGHWATSVEKVKSGVLMLEQQQTLFRTALGDLGAQVKAMLRDPALVIWLDGQKNTAQAPNENLARELMELFTLGIGNYTEDDVKAGARALTGWVVDQRTGAATLNPRRHDAKDKTILGKTGPFDADGFADILLAQPAHAEFVARRMWYRYASDQPMPDASLRAAASPQATQTLRAVLSDDGFRATAGQLVKQPVEWAVGAMRQLDIRPGQLAADQQRQLLAALDQLGQVPLQPPSVGGWPAGTAWLTTTSTQVRLRAGQLLASRASQAVLDRLSAVPAGQRVEALQRLLVVDAFTSRTREVLQTAAGQPRQLLALGLASPEYTVS